MSAAPLRRRLTGFLLIPTIAALSPLVVLPLVSRSAGPSGWASAIAGESIGTFAAIVIGYGWAAIGPALVSLAEDDGERARLYRESLVVRLILTVITLPALAIVCWLVASPGHEWLTVLMGLQGALIALSFTWYAAGTGTPRTIIALDAVPRLIAAAASGALIVATGVVELYPISGMLVTVGGTAVFTVRLLRAHPGPWPARGEVGGLLRAGWPVALNDMALSAYSSVPAPLVNVTSPASLAAGYASADKMFKLGSVIPFTLANALQAWVGEVSSAARAHRMRAALWAHAGFGVLGAVVLTALGPAVSRLLFGDAAAAGIDVLAAMGVVFAILSVRTSMTRHVLYPAGEARIVTRATLIATSIGVPAMVALAFVLGPVGVAIGYAATEAIATALLYAPCRSVLRALADTGDDPTGVDPADEGGSVA